MRAYSWINVGTDDTVEWINMEAVSHIYQEKSSPIAKGFTVYFLDGHVRELLPLDKGQLLVNLLLDSKPGRA